MKRRKRTILAIGILAVFVVWLASSAYVASRFTSRSNKAFAESPPKIAGSTVESLRLKTSDNEEIGGWLVRGNADKPCVLLLHGNGQSRAEMLPVMRWLADSRYTVLAISLRAHGDSTGNQNDIGWSARRDVVAAVQFLRHEFPKRPVVVQGRSLGAAAAIFAAADLKGDVAGYFLEQPYKDLKSAVWNRLQRHLPPVLDWIAYGGLRLWSPLFLPVDPDKISPCNRIASIPAATPVMIIAGSEDRHANFDNVNAVAANVPSGAKLIMFQGAKHEPLDRYDLKLYRTSFSDLLESVRAIPQ